MADMNTESFAKKLEEEKVLLEKELTALGRRNVGVPNDYEFIVRDEQPEADPLDEARRASDQEGNEDVFKHVEERYDSVLEALKRIEAGTYGTCAVCGAAIRPERLAANPAATACVNHQT